MGMAQRRFHYEQAFEYYLRANQIPAIAVDEAKRALQPLGVQKDLKNFDFVVHSQSGMNLLVDVKGRKISPRRSSKKSTPHLKSPAPGSTPAPGITPGITGDVSEKTFRGLGSSQGKASGGTSGGGVGGGFQNWVTADDVDSLRRWETLVGSNFQAVFVFLFWCEAQPPDALFQEIFEYHERWYVMRAIRLVDYQKHMRVRSTKWQTVHLPTKVFRELAGPLGDFL